MIGSGVARPVPALRWPEVRVAGKWLTPVALAAFMAAGILARLALAMTPDRAGDLPAYQIVANILRDGGNVYAQYAAYNYGPTWMGIIGATDAATRSWGIPLDRAIRVVLVAIDGAVAVVLALIARRAGSSGAMVASAYLLNPVGVLLTGLHGQFENLASIPLLCALALSFERASWRRDGLIAVLCGLTLITKHLLAFSVWAVLVVSQRTIVRALVLTVAAVALFLVSFVGYLPGGEQGIWRHVLTYSSLGGRYGLGWLPDRTLALALFVGIMGLLPLLIRRRVSPLEAAELAAVAFVAFTPGAGQQYFLLPVLFGSFRRSRWYWAFTAVVTAFLLQSFSLGTYPAAPWWIAVWIVATGWTVSLIAQIAGIQIAGLARFPARARSRCRPQWSGLLADRNRSSPLS